MPLTQINTSFFFSLTKENEHFVSFDWKSISYTLNKLIKLQYNLLEIEMNKQFLQQITIFVYFFLLYSRGTCLISKFRMPND